MNNLIDSVYVGEIGRTYKINIIGRIIDIIKDLHPDFWYHHCGYLFDKLYDQPISQLLVIEKNYRADMDRRIKQQFPARSISTDCEDGN
jgi:hypothetical protein